LLIIFLTFILIGLWHGMRNKFIVWGCLNGLFVGFFYIIDDKIRSNNFYKILSWFLMIPIVYCGQYLILHGLQPALFIGNSISQVPSILLYIVLLYMIHNYDSSLRLINNIKISNYHYLIVLLQIFTIYGLYDISKNYKFFYGSF
jgi:hypothetical protein